MRCAPFILLLAILAMPIAAQNWAPYLSARLGTGLLNLDLPQSADFASYGDTGNFNSLFFILLVRPD